MLGHILYVKWVSEERGRGVFSGVDIKAGEIVELAPILFLESIEADVVNCTYLGDYTYEYDEDWTYLVLGYGSLYNHANDPNVEWEPVDPWLGNDLTSENSFQKFFALRDIPANTELTISYGDDYTEEGFKD